MLKTAITLLLTALPLLAQTNPYQSDMVSWGSMQMLDGPVKAIAAGEVHTVALKVDGTVVGWGRNFYGQTNTPVGLANVIAIAAGGAHTVAITDGT
jgi:alpha-tubulin suppressor-like RCC1 family protein